MRNKVDEMIKDIESSIAYKEKELTSEVNRFKEWTQTADAYAIATFAESSVERIKEVNEEIRKLREQKSMLEYLLRELEGCIRCYSYQACETPNFFDSEIYESLTSSRKRMLERFIEQKGFDIPWGVERRD